MEFGAIIGADGGLVATCGYRVAPNNTKEDDANARLIAAAPELLRVAEMLDDVSDTKLGHLVYIEQLVNLFRDLRAQARAAIRKAKGEA